MSYSSAVDIGGTFTDIVLGRTPPAGSQSTNPHHPAETVIEGRPELLAKAGITMAHVDTVIHATTIVTNTIIERKAARTGLLTTDGIRDLLAIRNEHRYDTYDRIVKMPPPLSPRSLTFEGSERAHPDRSVDKSLDRASLQQACTRMLTEKGNSVAICFLHTYDKPENERTAASIVRELMPEMDVSISTDVAPQIREYQRASTTSANAYTMPITKPYLSSLSSALAEMEYPNKPLIMMTDAGVAPAETASETRSA